MRKITQKWAFLMMTLLCLVGMSQVVTAQTCVQIGEGTTASSSYLPVGSWYHYSYTQQLFTADEIEQGAGSIVSIGFQFNTASSTMTRKISIFMANTDVETFGSNFIREDLEEVLSPTVVTFSNDDDWVVIELETPFAYSGENLVVAVYMEQSTEETLYGNASHFLTFSSTNMARSKQSDSQFTLGTDNAPTDAGSTVSYRTNTQLCFSAGGSSVIPCDKPSGITASDVTARTATLTWADGNGVYNVEYKKTADTDWTPLLSATTLLTTELTGLEPNTDYQARVQSVCADNQDNPVSGWKTVSFKTMIGLPFAENFDALSAFPATDWNRYAGKLIDDVLAGTTTLGSTTTSGWSFSSSTTGVFESKHMYVNIWSTYKYWVVSPVLPIEDNVQLTFDMALSKSSSAYTSIIPGSQDDDKFVVLISTDSMATWTILRQWDNAGSEYVYDNIALYGEEVALDLSAYNGENIQLAFYGASTASGGDNYLHIDNILVDYIPSCFKPTDLAVVANSETKNSVQLEWTANSGEEAWVLQYKASDANSWQELNVTENPYLLEGLLPYTSYEVQVAAVCDPAAEDGTSKYSKAISFKTAATVPFEESFLATSLPGDWKRYKVLLEDVLAGDTTVFSAPVTSGWIASSTSNGVFPSAPGHLKLQVYGTACQNWIVSPFIEMDDNMQLTFDLALTKSSGTLEPREDSQQADDKFAVLITTDGGESWEELYTRDNVNTDPTYDQISCSAEGELVKIDLTAYASDKIAIAFYGESTEAGGNNYLHIANVSIDTIPACEKPLGVQLTAKSDTSVVFTWEEVEGATWSYAIIVDSVEGVVPSEADYVGSTQDFTAIIDTLQGNTPYAFYLRQDCGGAYSEPVDRHFTTMPAPLQAPWAEDFESLEKDKVAEFWDNSASSTTTVTGTNPHYVWGVYSYGGNKMIRMYNYMVQSGTALINTPSITLPTEPAYELTFDYAHTATCGDLSVKISADFGVSWATLPTTYGKTSTGTDNSNPGAFTEALIDLSDYAGSTIMIQFFANANYGSGAIFIDNVSVHEKPNCMKPQGLVEVEESVTTNSVQLDWEPQGTEANWLIQYKKATAEEWTLFAGDVNAHPFTLTGLDASSAYNVRVAAWCDPADSSAVSDYSAIISITTECDVVTIAEGDAYVEGFEAYEGTTYSADGVAPACWNVGIDGSATVLPHVIVSGGSYAYIHTGTKALTFHGKGNCYAALPEFANALNTLQIKFWSAMESATNGVLTLGYITADDPGDFTTFQALTTFANSYHEMEQHTARLDTIPAEAHRLVFRWYYSSQYSCCIDDIEVSLIPSCFEPASLKVVEAAATSMKFTYTAEEGDSLSYAIVLKGVEPTEFVGVTADTVLVEGLEAGTEYELYLRTECATSHSISLSASFQTKQLPIDLGDSFADDFEGANLWYFENGAIENAWVLGTAAHNGEGSTKALYISNDGGATNAYTISKSAVVYAMKAFNIAAGSYSFQYDWKAYGEGSSDYIRVALVPASVDLTAGTALPTGVTATALPEGLIALDGGSKLNLSSAWATFTSEELAIPAGTYNVVFMWRNDGSMGTQPSAAIDNFSITKILCGKPGKPTIEKANITATSAIIEWTADEGQTEWILAMDTIASFNKDSDAIQTVVSANPYTVENLLPEHTYYVYVRANCGENGYSAWSARANFKTAKACQKPDGLEITAITDSSAVVTWNTYGQSDFRLTFGTGNAYPDSVDVTGGTYTITGLDENTSYKVKVASSCDLTQWSSAKSFKTACSAIAAVVEDFDAITGSTSSNVLPDCWSYINTGSSSSYYPTAYASATYANSGTNSLRFYNYGSTYYSDEYAILPAVENLNTLRMKFNARKYSATYAAIVVVGIMTDPTDTATFVAIDTIAPAGLTYEPFVVSFGEYTGEGKYVALKAPLPATSSYNSTHIDDIKMEAIPSCLEPTALAASEISTTGASLDWTSAASEWQILLNNDSANLIAVAAKPYAISGLNPASTYTFAVRAICAEGDTSAWSKSAKFVTECDIISLANADYVQDFEEADATTYSVAGVVPACWLNGGNSTYPKPHVVLKGGSYAYTHSGNQTLNFCGSSNSNSYVALPLFAEALSQTQISFWMQTEHASNGELTIGYITAADEGDFSTYVAIDTFENNTSSMIQQELMLKAMPAAAARIAFRWQHTGSSFYSCCIDSVVVSLIPACPKTTGLEAVTVGDVTATFAWDAEADVTWEYGVVEDTVPNFVPADADFTGVATTNKVTVNALLPETDYLFFIRKICGSDKSEIIYKSFSTIMLAAALPYDDDFEGANSWMLINGTCTNAWTVGTLATESGNALYISNDGGTTYAYSNSSSTMVYAAKAFNFDKAGSYTVSYDWRANGEANWDYLRVAIVPSSVELAAGTSLPSGLTATGVPEGWKAADGGLQLSGSDAWQSKAVVVENIVPGYYYLVFAWRNDGMDGNQSPAAVDNLHIQHLDYPTAIGGIDAEGVQAVKFIENDHVYILINDVIYDATGRKVK
ncbi:MAG: fibronectin type III domain-containing protein [Paludibacteraceae bacterium]|nr:fibronectin type III domain-containing protein [Paludibacteraceae bacterium]